VQELLVLLLVILVSTLFSYKRSKFIVGVVAILTNYIILLAYWTAGIYLHNEYEPEMLIGWFILSSLSTLIVVPASITFAWAMRKFTCKTNNAT